MFYFQLFTQCTQLKTDITPFSIVCNSPCLEMSPYSELHRPAIILSSVTSGLNPKALAQDLICL